MFRVPRSVLSFGAAAVGIAALMLAVPRAAHAVAAALVEVVNTTANPAITQDTSKQASQIVTLVCYPANSLPAANACIQIDARAHYSATQPYAVPSNAWNVKLSSPDQIAVGVKVNEPVDWSESVP